jgi:phosphonoacetaldehyde hydrolase
MSSSAIRGVIFDLSGTVIDFGSRGPAIAFVELFARRGIHVSLAEARRPMGTHKRDHIAAMLADFELQGRWRDKYGRPPGEEEIAELYEQFAPLQVELLPRFCDLIPGVRETVEGLHARGIPYAATTGFDRSMMPGLIPRIESQGFRPVAFLTPNDVGAGRPAPWMAFEAARRMNVYPPSAIVKVGDTEADMAEARNAGMWAVGVVESGNEIGFSREEWAALDEDDRRQAVKAAESRLRGYGAHYTIPTVASLLPLLDSIGTNKLGAGLGFRSGP